ncbi:tetratricopeptide repeat protein [Poriferisphaera sp. WC338]|uniref:tetratricopeptide repeat protein n=1 Tax=Poriferisphaera sp. WC338 TaxID=3425129 RepID=UPI003D8150CB
MPTQFSSMLYRYCTLAAILLSLSACAPTSGPRSLSAKQEQALVIDQHLTEADVYIARGLSDSALASFGLALEENPNLLKAHLGMGDIYRQHGNFELAKRAYKRATVVAPNDFRSHYSLALMHHMLEELKQSIPIYLKALTLKPNSFEANRDIAAAYLQLGKPHIALNYNRRATEIDPDQQSAWTNLGANYAALKQFNDAVNCYRQAAELGDLDDPVLLGLGDAHTRLGNFDRAITVLASLVRTSPSVTAYERLGYAYFKSREFKRALKHFRKALEYDPNDISSLNGVGVCLMTLYIEDGRENMVIRNEAVDMWRRSLQVNPEQPRIADFLSRYDQL